jgi:hypothetical protein
MAAMLDLLDESRCLTNGPKEETNYSAKKRSLI